MLKRGRNLISLLFHFYVRYSIPIVVVCVLQSYCVVCEIQTIEGKNHTTTIASAITQQRKPQRPIMYTFFERIPQNERFTGMTDEADDALLKFWEQRWFAAGWDPRVITVEDAKKHAHYKSFLKILNEMNLDEFSKLSIVRWIAMAAVGGGSMVDYDVFPLRDFKEEELQDHGEKFVLYDNFLSPTFASGSADMWLALGKALLATVKYHTASTVQHSASSASINKKLFFTDTMGLMELSRAEPQIDAFHKNVSFAKVVLDGKMAVQHLDQYFKPEDCNKRPFRGRAVVHFSVSGLFEGVGIKPEHRHPQHRLTVAKEFLQKWSIACHNKTKWEVKR